MRAIEESVWWKATDSECVGVGYHPWHWNGAAGAATSLVRRRLRLWPGGWRDFFVKGYSEGDRWIGADAAQGGVEAPAEGK